MKKKQHAPIEQLRIAGAEAKKKLIERGIISDKYTLDGIEKEEGIMLPGYPNYLPHKWTLKASQQMMYDLLKLWQFKNTKHGKYNESQIEKLTNFIEFMLQELRKHENIAKRKMDMTPAMIKRMRDVPVLGKIFEPVNQYETVRAMSKFFVDSFAVAIIVKGKAATTSEYAEWFLEWTDNMQTIWENKKDVKKD